MQSNDVKELHISLLYDTALRPCFMPPRNVSRWVRLRRRIGWERMVKSIIVNNPYVYSAHACRLVYPHHSLSRLVDAIIFYLNFETIDRTTGDPPRPQTICWLMSYPAPVAYLLVFGVLGRPSLGVSFTAVAGVGEGVVGSTVMITLLCTCSGNSIWQNSYKHIWFHNCSYSINHHWNA